MRSKALARQVATVQDLGERLAHARALAPPVLHEPPPRPLVRQTGRFQLLPRSFRDFLVSHNGWELFWSGFSLRGITGTHTVRAVQDIRARVEQDQLAFQQAHDRTHWDERQIVLPDHPIFGTDFAGQLLLFDIRRVDQRGENPVVLWNQQCGIVRTFSSLLAMLEHIAAEQQHQLSETESPGAPPPPDRRQKILEALRRVQARRRQQELELTLDFDDPIS